MPSFPSRISSLSPLFCLSLLLACSDGAPVVEDEDTDTTPPDAITDLLALNPTSQSATLYWTAPADRRDDGTDGSVVAYDLRVADATITEDNFDQARAVAGVPAPATPQLIQSMIVTGLTPGATCHFSLRSCDAEGNWSAVSDCPHVDCTAPVAVEFPDPGLEQAIRAHVHRPAGGLTSSDVDTILHFAAAGAGIADLSGMQACLSLRTARLVDNEIAGLEPLRHLIDVRGLYLDANAVSDLEPLAGLLDLQQLHLAWNPVTDLSPLVMLQQIRQLTLSGTVIADYTPLTFLGYLNDLYLGDMELQNIDFLVNLRQLRLLNLEINHIQSLEALRYHDMIESLNLMQNGVVDLAPLAGLTNLRNLNLAGNLVADLQPLLDNAGLGAGDAVDLRNNPLSAQALAVQVPALEGRGVVVQH
ncbi:MAG: hypothetical protein IPH09_16870 [bacterium]|nr:hypothetical protein [bacterium]